MIIDRVTHDEANAILVGAHYLGSADYASRYCMATQDRKAVAVFSDPIAAHFKTVIDHPIELARLWRADDAPFVASQFLAACLRHVRKIAPGTDCVFTYADPAARNSATGKEHNGGVYVAANFTFIRKTRAIDKWRLPSGKILSAAKVYRKLRTKDRDAIMKVRPKWTLIPGVPKRLFVYPMRLSVTQVLAKLANKMPEARRAMFSKAHAGFRASVYQETFPPLTCAHCKKLFLARRNDARTCSPTCRTMLWKESP
jgi:hypothetical protein